MKNIKSKAWDEIGGLFWTEGRKTARPSREEIEQFLSGSSPEDNCLVLGASTFYLIQVAAKRGMNVTVVDFSKKMLDDLQEYADFTLECVLADILKPTLKETLGNREFDLIVCDRLINRFHNVEVPAFFSNIEQLLTLNGSFHASIKMGLYPMDERLIDLAQKKGVLELVYEPESKTINYQGAVDILKEAILPHGEIDPEKLYRWYVGRNKESRFSKDDIEALIKNNSLFSNNEVDWEEFLQAPETFMLNIH